MKRPAGLIAFASLFLIIGVSLLMRMPALSDSWSTGAIRVAIGVMSLGVAYALWHQRTDAMKAYWVWVVAWLAGGGALQYLAGDSPVLHVVIWWVLVGSVLLAVGAYLRSALRQTV